jgi:hypothetical protein
MTRVLSVVLSIMLAGSGCAANIANQRRPIALGNQAPAIDAMLMSDYLRQLPIGSRLRVTLASGKVIRGTLMKHDGDPIVVQRRTRVPEPPTEIRVADIAAAELDGSNGSLPRHLAVGAAAAAGVTIGVLLVLAAIFAD